MQFGRFPAAPATRDLRAALVSPNEAGRKAASEYFFGPGEASLVGVGIPSEEAFGVGLIGYDQTLSDGTIPSEESFGVGTIGFDQALTGGGGIASQEAFGVGTIAFAEEEETTGNPVAMIV